MMVRGLEFCIQQVEGLYYLRLSIESKGADQLHGSPQLICAFVFANAKSRFSLFTYSYFTSCGPELNTDYSPGF